MATNFKEMNSSLVNFIKKYDNIFEEYKELYIGKMDIDPIEDNEYSKKLKNKAEEIITVFCSTFKDIKNYDTKIDEHYKYIVFCTNYYETLIILTKALLFLHKPKETGYINKLITDYPYKFNKKIGEDELLQKTFLLYRLCIIWKRLGSSYNQQYLEAKKLYFYHTLMGGYLRYNKLPTNAYSFRKCTTYLYQALINEKINLTSPWQYNDPLDCPIKDLDESFRKAVRGCIKMTCFVNNISLEGKKKASNDNKEEYTKLLMWAHYADSHQGICIKYNFSSFDLSSLIDDKSNIIAFFNDIEYSNEKLTDTANQYKEGNEISGNDALFLKSEDWKYENELRLLYFDVNGKGDYTSIDAPHCIEAIYFGYKCSDEDKKTIHKILKDKTVIKDENGNFKSENIKFYQMEIDKDNFGQIKAVDYNPD
ncbi:MAG: DUF2971 domain-containing protein [Bacteroidaceae bacterium]|nr:DUF2971 domain-containing protein [Bacteroidaceae bacterium]